MVSRKLALIIGNSEYEDSSLAHLVTPDADVGALAEVLRDPQVGGFDEAAALVNQPADAIRRAISAFFAGRSQDDLLLLYFSGHGIRDDRGQLFLAARDTEHGLLRGTAIPAAFITEEMDNSRSRSQVLILDCCHSGAFSSGMKAATGESAGTAAAFEGTGSGRVVLTATDSTQYAWEGDRVVGQAENSVFTHYLIQGLRSGEADSDADGRITLDELYNYVYERVVDQTPLQTPGKWSYGQRGEIVIARNPSPVVKPLALPPDLQQTIDDSRPWVREGAVQELDRILHGSNPGLALSARLALQRLDDDDSRRVASLAAASLASGSGLPAAATAGATVFPAQAAAGPAVQPPATPGASPVQRADSSAAAPPPAPSAGAPKKASGPGLAAVYNAWASSRARPAHPVARRDTPGWLPLLVTILGCTVGFAIGFSLTADNSNPWVGTLVGAITGLAVGMGLRWKLPALRWRQVALIILGWALAVTLGWGASAPLAQFYQGMGYSTSQPSGGGAIGFFIGLTGGLATGLALRWAGAALHGERIIWIVVGWIAAGAAGFAFLAYLIETIGSEINPTLGGALIGVVIGAIGSAIMYWQLRTPPPIAADKSS